jgi:RHS repeat-associated protein
MNSARNQNIAASITRRNLPPRCSRITYSRPNAEKRVPQTLFSAFVYFNDLPIATLRPKGANAGVPLGISGTTTGNPANGATAANANNVGNNSTTNRVNVEVFYMHADHLGTPRVVTRSTVATGANAPSSATPTSPGAINKAVWRHDSDPFGTSLGNSQPAENPQIITGTAAQIQAGTFKQNQRFPGQLADGESGKQYNYFRDYDSSVGRYSTSDPIGLRGGLNTFGYVGQQPNRYDDPAGLSWTPWCYLDPSNPDCYDRISPPAPRPPWVPPDKPIDPKVDCVIKCLTKEGAKTVVVTGATYAAAYAAAMLLAPEITLPATVLVLSIKYQFGTYYLTVKFVWTVYDCMKECKDRCEPK